jgi:hypothetical protein
MKHKIYKESIYFQKFIFIQKFKKKSCHLPEKIYAFFIKICKNNYSKFQSNEKQNWAKGHGALF